MARVLSAKVSDEQYLRFIGEAIQMKMSVSQLMTLKLFGEPQERDNWQDEDLTESRVKSAKKRLKKATETSIYGNQDTVMRGVESFGIDHSDDSWTFDKGETNKWRYFKHYKVKMTKTGLYNAVVKLSAVKAKP